MINEDVISHDEIKQSVMDNISEQPKDVGITPTEYFATLKERKQKVTKDYLKAYYDECMYYLGKYQKTNQLRAIKKLIYHAECVETELKLLEKGIDTYVMYDDIFEYIEGISKKVVKIIDIEDYERDIPDDIAERVSEVRELFTRVFVVFTDYTGKEEKKVEKKLRDKDPIIFGAFINSEDMVRVERFYFLGDWEDEYCDLTLDKLVAETMSSTGLNVKHSVAHSFTPESLRESLFPKNITS